MKTKILLMSFLLASCGDDRPPAPTAAEAEQLNAMEELLNEQAAKEKGPESSLPGPSNRSD